jgi:OOP family OmpA-OmpF porin
MDMSNLLRLLPLAALLPASLAAHADEGDWYVSPSIVYFDDDGDRLIDDAIAGGQVQVGREMSDKFWLEGLLGYHDIDGFPGQEHLELGVSAIRSFRPDGLFEPYAIGGLGLLRADVGLPSFGGVPAAGDASTSFTLSAGLGTLVNFGDSPWALRAEWRFRHAFDDDGLTDQLVALGIQYSFGGGSTVAAPAAVSQPEPERYADSDGDGITDDSDRCPGTPAGAVVDMSGCEVRTAPEAVEFENIYFGFDSDVVLATAQRLLDDVAATLKRNPDVTLEIGGFADARGPESYNMKLSQRRAEAVRDFLVAAGVNPDNVSVVAYGESRADASDLAANTLAEDRRVELRVTKR